MGTMTDSQSIAANTTVDNVLAGKTDEFLREPSLVRVAITGGGADMHATLIIGNEMIIDAQELNPSTAWPIFPDNFLAEGVGDSGERIVLRLENRSGGALVPQTYVTVEPL
jgi:hypothetical protein